MQQNLMTEPVTEPIYVADPDTIVVLDKRQRKGYDMAEMRKLENSIAKHGQMQAGVCRKDGEDIVLISGFRRLTACKNLDLPYRYKLLDEITDPVVREEMELHENLIRENLTFLDEAAARSRLHKLYMETRATTTVKGKPNWSIERTAQELGISKTTLRDDIELDQFARSIPAVAGSKTRSDGKKTIKRLKNQVLQNETLKQIQSQAQPEDCTILPEGSREAIEAKLKCAVDNFSAHVHEGNFIELLPEISKPESFDVVFFDPPWGVNFSDVFQLSGSQQGYSDKRKDFFKNLEQWLLTIHTYMKPNSHLYMKFGITSHFWVVRTLTRVGFQTSGIPIIWRKKGSHRTRSPERTFGRCYEPILLAHKGQKPIQLQGREDYIETPTPSPTMKDIHPSTMHPKLPYELLQRSCFPGDHILDPMCGSGMTGVAAEALKNELQLDYTLIDIDKSFCNLAIKNLLTGYGSIVNEPLLPEVTDFRTIKPGSPEWIQHWTDNPDQHDQMMEFSKNGE